LSNNVCVRNGNCFSHEFFQDRTPVSLNSRINSGSLDSSVLSRMRDILTWCKINAREDTECLLTVGLESNYDEAAAHRMVDLAREAGWSDLHIVHNPDAASDYTGSGGAHFVEYHGLFPDTERF